MENRESAKASPVRASVSALSIGTLVALWVISLLVVWTGLVTGLFIAKARLSRIDRQVALDVRALDAAQELEVAVLWQRREDLLWAATGQDQHRTKRDEYLAAAEGIATRLGPFISTQEERQASTQILQELTTLRRSFESGQIDTSQTELVVARLLTAVQAFKVQNDGQMQTSLQAAERLGGQLSDAAIALSAGTAVLLVLGSWGIVTRVIRPALAMTDAAEAFGQGDFSSRVTVRHNDEMGELARTFNNMAEDIANREQDRLSFVAMVVHDLKNPAYAIEMAARTLPKAGDDPQERQLCLDTLTQESKRLRAIIRDLTDDVQVATGRFSIRKEGVDLCALVQGLVQTQLSASPDRRIVLEQVQACRVLGDADRLARVVQNLLSNAVKYSPSDTQVAVRVATKGPHAVLAVSDQGPGISPDDLKILFQPFGRGRSAAHLAEGSGMGLYIVKQIVEAHGGRIDVDSTPGCGTTFRVALPLA
jgi:signal transduction histidine kinase